MRVSLSRKATNEARKIAPPEIFRRRGSSAERGLPAPVDCLTHSVTDSTYGKERTGHEHFSQGRLRLGSLRHYTEIPYQTSSPETCVRDARWISLCK